MNLLVDTLPEAVAVGGVIYPIRCDHRTCLRIILAFEDPDLTAAEKRALLLYNLYPEIPENVQEAYEVGVRFLDGGKTPEADGEARNRPRVVSFSKDANLIYAAFRQTHGIDLSTANLHWWEFLALFMDLGSETTFCQLVSLRHRVKTGKATKEELKAYRENKDIIDVPELDTRTLEDREKEAEFFRLVGVSLGKEGV